MKRQTLAWGLAKRGNADSCRWHIWTEFAAAGGELWIYCRRCGALRQADTSNQRRRLAKQAGEHK